jgi:hypothetical protein
MGITSGFYKANKMYIIFHNILEDYKLVPEWKYKLFLEDIIISILKF